MSASRIGWILAALLMTVSLGLAQRPHDASSPAERDANAQRRAPSASEPLVRVTYAVADLVVPIPNYSRAKDAESGPDELARRLINLITTTIDRSSWEDRGGHGTIQYFPLGKALVVSQRRDVHAEIAQLLSDLRKLQDVQIAVELRMVVTGAKFGDAFYNDMPNTGEPARALALRKPSSLTRMTVLDDRQVFAFMEMSQEDRATNVVQAPKITLFNGQQAGLSVTDRDVGSPTACAAAPVLRAFEKRNGLLCTLWPVVGPDPKSVRLAMDLDARLPVGKAWIDGSAEGTFVIPEGRTLVMHLGKANGHHLFTLVTPRVLIVTEEPLAKQDSEAEEQSAREPRRAEPRQNTRGSRENNEVLPSPRSPQPKLSPRERAIEYRLSRPITLHMKDRPLLEALKDISAISGIQIVPDISALEAERINLNAPLSISVENIELGFALKVLLEPLQLTCFIENDVLKITILNTERKVYPGRESLRGDLGNYPFPADRA